MSDGVLSAGVFRSPQTTREPAAAEEHAGLRIIRDRDRWDPASFAREQIQGLVRQIFFSQAKPHVRQVVFIAVDTGADVIDLCRGVGETLSLETAGSIAVTGSHSQIFQSDVDGSLEEMDSSAAGLRRFATKLSRNLWLLPFPLATDSEEGGSPNGQLCGLRREFDFSIVGAQGASEAIAMAQLADGIVMVLSAHRTRRTAALRLKERLETARARLLGAVLSDRVFPIPERIYRRL